jgi:Ni/Fe-hydrogenase subunit HybB-like protein
MNSRTRVIKDVLWTISLAGLVAALLRLWFGLGATTNLSDAVPWGLWKVLNMIAGVALSTSGFTVGFLVYVLRLKQFRPFMKPAILIAFLGYGCSCTALLFDIGLPYRFWHPMVMWNINSFLFEVFWCVLLYFNITAIELAPIIFERLRAEKAAHFLHRIAFVIVVVGISLSSLHHSSLGSLFLVTPQRLHPLWYTPWLPLLFIVSAMGAGLMVVVLATILWTHWYEPKGTELPQLRSLASIGAAVLSLYLVLKLADLFLHGGWQPLLAGTWESWLYILELGLTAVLPVALIALARHSRAGIAVAAASATLGLALNRLDVGIFGYFRTAHTVYFPSFAEWMLSLGVVAAAGLVFFFAAENLPIFSEQPPGTFSLAGPFRLSGANLRQLWNDALADSLHRVTLIAVFVIPLAFALMYPPYFNQSASGPTVPPANGLDVERTKLELSGNDGSVRTVFPHADHVKRLGRDASCVRCHHVSLPHDNSTSCARCHSRMNAPTDIFDHQFHMTAVARRDHLDGMHAANYSCVECHAAQRPKTAATAKPCLDCHQKDMFPAGPPEKKLVGLAIPLREAMHQTCIGCHNTEVVKQNKPHLADCQTCHESLRTQPISQLAQVSEKGAGANP